MVDTQPLRQEFMWHLRATFGKQFVELVAEPPGVQIGERVLYRLRGGHKATRRESTPQELVEFHNEVVEMAKRTGASAVTTEPATSSGLPFPRLIDLPGSGIAWDRDLRQWAASGDLLPLQGFSLEWAIGVIVMPSRKLLLYLDFTHPKIKGVFRVFYDDEDGRPTNEGVMIRARFKQFCEKAQGLRAQYSGRTDIVWVKLVQIDDEPICIRVRETT